MSIPLFKFEFQYNEPTNERVARCAKEVLTTAGGEMSNLIQHDYYKDFISCGENIDLSGVHTSCGIFVRAVLYHSGLKVNPAKIGQGLLNGWVQFDQSHPSWVKYKNPQITVPEVGSIGFIQSLSNPSNCHVFIFVEDLGNGTWKLAAGGGGDGTKCSFSQANLGPQFDHYGRNLVGWFRTNMIGLPESENL